MADVSGPAPKRMRIAYHHRHKIQHAPQELPPHEPTLIEPIILDKLLIGSIKNIFEEEGLRKNIHNPIIESIPLEALRNVAEEFMLQLCSKVRRSMLAARRTAPIGPDFESAFDVLDLPRPDDQLEPYQTHPRINPSLLPTPPPDDSFHEHVELPTEFLGPDLSKQNDLKKYAFNTGSLPPLPSAHTYKDTAMFSEREFDTRKIREMATDEGKLGEQALRKLAAAVKLETALSTEADARLIKAKRGPSKKKPVLTEEALFEETMKDLLKSERGDFELGPIVTAEKGYRMPDDVRVKRRPAATTKPALSSTAIEVSPSKQYNLLPPPVVKRITSNPAPNSMDLSFEL